ncbi:MAG: hypothetical protein KKF50_04845 [Nanoarchaeota archaeon]|nr:hypothetical protein [Nanoarchaeota archaeon]
MVNFRPDLFKMIAPILIYVLAMTLPGYLVSSLIPSCGEVTLIYKVLPLGWLILVFVIVYLTTYSLYSLFQGKGQKAWRA